MDTGERAALVVSICGAALTWLLTLERRLSARMTRREHAQLCEKSKNETLDRINTLIASFEEERKRTQQHRERQMREISDIRVAVAVLRDRQGDNPFHSAESAR